MKTHLLLFGLIASISLYCQKQKSDFQYFPLNEVELLNSPFKTAQDINKEYLLSLDPNRLLSPFLREAGLVPKAESYTNWENTGLDGHIGGHYLSALSYMYASTGDNQIGERLNYMISELKLVQDANGDGYIGGVPDSKKLWKQISEGNIQAAHFQLNGKWVPLYNIHKTYAGLRDAWIHTENVTAKNMLIAMADWMNQLVSGLNDEQLQDMLQSEHGGLNEIFADIAAITGNTKYLNLARRFSHQEILKPLLEQEDKLTGLHANTQIPKIIGFKRISDIDGNESWRSAAQFFWETVIQNRSVCIGGNSVHEHFNPTENFFRMVSTEQGPETCNTCNMLRLTMMLNKDIPHSTYVDYYERALYNHILSTQNPRTGGLVYFTPMRPAHYRVYSQPETSMWCCVGSGIENHSKYGEIIYAHQGNKLYVNLFIPSRLNWEEEGIEIIQTNKYPEEQNTSFVINTIKPRHFELKIRYPKWSQKVTVTINGESQPISKGEDGYICLDRTWKNGDRIFVELPMELNIETFPDHSGFRSTSYGPIVLAARNGTKDMTGLFADDSRGGHIAHGPKEPFENIPIVVSDRDSLLSSISPISGKPLHFTMKTSSGFIELEPFYGIHESRYTIYWPTSPVKNSSEALMEATVDMIYCGQQQPESDHFISFEDSETGYSSGKHWRKAKDWFAYKLNNTNGAGHFLLVSYLNTGQKTQAVVSVNGKVVKNISTGDGVEKEIHTLIHLTDEHSVEKLMVKISAAKGLSTPLITEIRVLSRNVIEE